MTTIPNGGFGIRNKTYNTKHEWGCFVQCGESGLVLGKEPYHTAFFEAFPRNPDTFIRGEGKTVRMAEESAWKKYQKYNSCPNHEYERRGYTNGAGFCKHCGLFKSKAFEPSTLCKVCRKPTDWTRDKNNDHYCEEDEKYMTPDLYTDVHWAFVDHEKFKHEHPEGLTDHELLMGLLTLASGGEDED